MATPVTRLMVERCAQIIEQVIIPKLTEDFVLAQAMHVAMFLHSLAPVMEEKSQELREENEGMREVLGRVLEALRVEKSLSRNALRNGLIERLDDELKKLEVGPPDVAEETYSLKGVLVETIKGLDALTEDLPTETMSSLRQHIRSVLRQQLDHGAARMEARMAARMARLIAMLPIQFSDETPH